MIDHIPLRRAVYTVVSRYPSRNPATFKRVSAHFLPKYSKKVKTSLIHLVRNGYIESVGQDSYLISGQKKATPPALLYVALLEKNAIGDEIKHKEVMETASLNNLNKAKGESALQSLINCGQITRIGRGQLRLEAELPDTMTLNELGALLPPHKLVWGITDAYLPTKAEEMIEVLASDTVSPTMIESAINDLYNRDCLDEMATSDGSSEGFLRAKNYKPSAEELVYYSFNPNEKFSPKDAKEQCLLTGSEVHQALCKLREHGLVVRDGRGVYRTLSQGVRQDTTPVSEPVVSEPVVSEPVVSEPVIDFNEVVLPAPRVSSISLGDFERVARQFRSSLKEAEDFYRSIEPQENEINQLREQAKRLLEQAESVESTIIDRKRKLDDNLNEAKQALAPFVR